METLLHQEVRQSVWQSITLVLHFVVHHFQRDSAPTFLPDSPPEIWSCICSPSFSVFWSFWCCIFRFCIFSWPMFLYPVQRDVVLGTCTCTRTISKDPTTPQVCRYTTLCPTKAPQRVSLIATLVSGIAGMSASSSSKADTLNIWCKNCKM